MPDTKGKNLLRIKATLKSIKMNVITILCTVLLLFGGTYSASSDSKVISLDEDNWRALLENEWMVEL